MSPNNANAPSGLPEASTIEQLDNTGSDKQLQTETADSITILHSRNNHPLCKKFYRNKSGETGVVPYPKVTYFRAETRSVENIHVLAQILYSLERNSSACVIRGGLREGVDPSCILRRSVARGEKPAPIQDVSRRWIMLDIDGLICPALTDPALDPTDALGYVLGYLPYEFCDVSCYWQFSASQGFKDNTLSMHLWFFLDRLYSNAELKKYVENANIKAGFKLIDPALFTPVQPHYTAVPIFENIANPLPQRSGFWQSLEDIVTLNIPAEGIRNPGYHFAAGYRPGLGYWGYINQIGDGKDGFRRPILAAIASYIASNGIEGTDREVLKADIRYAAENAAIGNRSIFEIERYESDCFLDGIINWVIAREREKVRTPNFVTSLPSYFPSPSFSNAEKAEAQQNMKEAISNYVQNAVALGTATRRGDDGT